MMSPVARIQYPQRGPLLAVLSAEAARLLGSHLRETELREGALLWDAGPDAGRIFFPISGIISVRVPTGNGHGIEVATIGPEAAAGFHDGWARIPVLTQGIVHSSGRFAIISVEAFHAAAGECEELGRLAAACKGWMLAQSQRTAACNAAHSADARFCRWLLRMSDALGQDVVRVTQESIAEALGIRRTTANLIAQQLQFRGTITCGRGKIAIRDRASLELAACDCYSALGRSHWPSELLRAGEPSTKTEGQAVLSPRI